MGLLSKRASNPPRPTPIFSTLILGFVRRLGDRAKVDYAQSMPFTDHQFEVVVMSEVIEHLTGEELHVTLKEVFRVLKSKGRFIGTGSCFAEVTLSRHFFGDVHSPNRIGRISSAIKKIMVGMGMAGSGESYFFSVLKK
jgi:hypothetical protein